jgi:hypothetical protein
MDKFVEIKKLHEMLAEANIPHTLRPCWDGLQIRIYADEEMTKEIDDCVCHSGSYGNAIGLLETYRLHDCEGWETAEQVFNGWKEMYQRAKGANQKTADCTIIGADGEIWEGSMPSWD